MGGLFSRHRDPPAAPNPSIADIEARQRAEAALKRAEEDAQRSRELAEQIRRDYEEDRKRARERQEEADKAARLAQEQTQKTMMDMVEAERAAIAAKAQADVAAASARADADRLAQQAREERERAERVKEEAQRAAAEAKAEAERVQRAADEERQKSEAARAAAEKAARDAEEETRKAQAEKQEADEKLKKGIQPVVTPSAQEMAAAKKRIQYKEGIFHFAVAGVAGSGKSSLINAFRGLKNKDAGAAATGVTETTLAMTRYPDANPQHPFVWYDIPGAGTLKIPDWQYFNIQGLYVFDCIIILFDNRFTMTDIAILTNCRRFNIPTYIVRSKADQHIRNIMRDMGYDSDDDDDEPDRRNKLYKAARKQFIQETRNNVKANLENANMPDQRVYIVSNDTMLGIVKEKTPRKTIDELDLLTDLFSEAHARRSARVSANQTTA
ncbi:interferon-inducible GTPase-domain-containing protein [Phlebopus sp. FC_14]|nr:interferon-inducible GTPase-domain-containing protein [Phlebopus sp. FC_14]